MSNIQRWFDNMKEIWVKKDPNRIHELLSDHFEYYENPFEKALTADVEVISAWQDILDQDIEYVEVDILYECDNVGIATWRFKEHDKSEHIGSYYLKLDDAGKCVEFRQWWMEVPANH